MAFQKKLFTQGIDSDTTSELLPDGRDRYRLNVRVLSSNNSTLGAIETVNGNTLVSFTLPSGTNTCIGSTEDMRRKKLYYFLYNSTNEHSILEYDAVSNTIAKVLQSSILNFNPDYLITGISIIELDASNHLLYWTDYYNEPRKINIEKGKYFMQGDYVNGYKSPFDPLNIYRIKKPQLFPPTYVWSNDSSQNINYLFKKLFTFKVQHIFDDKDISSWSPISKYVMPETLDSGGSGEDISRQDNKITVTVDTGSAIVTTIRIAAKEVNEANYKIVAVLNKAQLGIANNTTYDFDFYNNGNYLVLPVRESNKLFDNIPFLSKAQEGIFGGRITDGNIVEGCDPVEIDMRLPISYEVLQTNPNTFFPAQSYLKCGGTYKTGIVYYEGKGNRSGTANITDGKDTQLVNDRYGTTLYIPFITDDDYNPGFVVTYKLSSVTIASAGSGYLVGEVLTLSGGTSTVASQTTVATAKLVSVAVNAPGTNYALGDTITLAGGTFSVAAVLTVNTVGGGGEVLTFTISTPGSYTVTSTSFTQGATSGVGTGATFNTGLFGVLSVVVTTLGNYTVTPANPVSTTSSGAGTGATLTAVWAYISANNGLDYVPIVSPHIYHRPPSWASHYQIVRSRNEAMDRYIQFSAQNVLYLDTDQTTIVAPALASFIKVDISNISGRYLFENPDSLLVYDFVPGDRIRFIANKTWTTLTPTAGSLAPVGGNATSYTVTIPASGTGVDVLFDFNDNQIASYDSGTGTLIIRYNPSAIVNVIPNNLLPGVLFEIYSPAENVINNNEIMYEIGECRSLSTDSNGDLIHEGDVNQKFIDFTSAIYAAPNFEATLLAGHGLAVNDEVKVVTDDYSVYGIVTVSGATTVNIDTTGYTLVGTFNGSIGGEIIRAAIFDIEGGDSFRRYQDMPAELPAITRLYAYVDAENVSNMFASKAWNQGRPNRIDPEYRRISRETTIYYSERFIPETNINGLSTVYDTSFESYDPIYGSIQKLYNEDQRLIMFQELKVGQIPISQVIYNDLQGGTTVGASSDVLTDQVIYYTGEYGIGKNPESFAVYAKSKYFIDVRRGTPVRLSLDGLTPIGDTAFMHNYFNDACRIILNSNAVSKIYGVYDTRFYEYIISINGETLAFNEKENQWSTFYSYVPENMCSNGMDIVSFKNGALYKHNENSTQANFYGVQYYPEVWVTLNSEPSNVKIMKAVGLETDTAWICPSIITPGGQETNLIADDFQLKERMQYAPLWRDTNTPNVANPLFEGDEMRDTTFLCKFKWPNTTYNKLFAINLSYIISNLHNR